MPTQRAVTPEQYALSCASVSKTYPGVVALDDVSIGVRGGQVHALLGENGAGKSTLIKILVGAERPDSGAVYVGGQLLPRPTPVAARRLGVRLLPQERHIATDLTVAHNVLVDSLPRNAFGAVSMRALNRRAQPHLDSLGIDVRAGQRAGDLNSAQQQLVELARATAQAASVVVLDEPTASLAGDEVRVLFRAIRSLRERGVALLYVSHHLQEVFEIADTATVLRNGRRVFDSAVIDTDMPSLLRQIFDRDVVRDRMPRPPKSDRAGRAVVEVVGAQVNHHLAPTDVTVRSGEILALSGPSGSGTSALAELIAGVRRPNAGSVQVGSTRLRSRTHAARLRIGYVPADRKRDALLLGRSITENLEVGPGGDRLHRPQRARRKALNALASARIRSIDPGSPVRVLSGGNQQRVVFARWLLAGSDVLVLDQPTAGVDIAAKFSIYEQLLDLAASGVAVAIVSSDYEEIAAIADRVVVMRHGVPVGEIAGDQATPELLYQLESEHHLPDCTSLTEEAG